MANNVHVSVARRNAMLDNLAGNLNTGTIKFYDGSQPANADTAITSQVLLATLTFGNPAFAAAGSGSAAANAITSGSAVANGTATWARIQTSGAANVIDCSVGTSGCDINMNTVSFVTSATISLSAFSLTTAA